MMTRTSLSTTTAMTSELKEPLASTSLSTAICAAGREGLGAWGHERQRAAGALEAAGGASLAGAGTHR